MITPMMSFNNCWKMPGEALEANTDMRRYQWCAQHCHHMVWGYLFFIETQQWRMKTAQRHAQVMSLCKWKIVSIWETIAKLMLAPQGWGWLNCRDFLRPPYIYFDINMSKLFGISLLTLYFTWWHILICARQFHRTQERIYWQIHVFQDERRMNQTLSHNLELSTFLSTHKLRNTRKRK